MKSDATAKAPKLVFHSIFVGMITLDYWHPVLPSRELGRKPVGVKICGQEILLFRTEQGVVGALEDRCPYRRMRMSKGWVEGQRLVCPYRGWSFDRISETASPGTPNLHACAQIFEALSATAASGFLWAELLKDFWAAQVQEAVVSRPRDRTDSS